MPQRCAQRGLQDSRWVSRRGRVFRPSSGMVDATIRIPGLGSSVSGAASRIQRLAPRPNTRRGCMTVEEITRPSQESTATDMGQLNVNVWIDRASSNTGDPSAPRMPRSLSSGVPSTQTSTNDQDPPVRRTLRYIRVPGTLVAPWQRQNDANSGLAVPRRTTAASPTPAAADSATPLFLSPNSGSQDLCTPRRQRCEGICRRALRAVRSLTANCELLLHAQLLAQGSTCRRIRRGHKEYLLIHAVYEHIGRTALEEQPASRLTC